MVEEHSKVSFAALNLRQLLEIIHSCQPELFWTKVRTLLLANKTTSVWPSPCCTAAVLKMSSLLLYLTHALFKRIFYWSKNKQGIREQVFSFSIDINPSRSVWPRLPWQSNKWNAYVRQTRQWLTKYSSFYSKGVLKKIRAKKNTSLSSIFSTRLKTNLKAQINCNYMLCNFGKPPSQELEVIQVKRENSS